jgi:hypothetical protein
MPEMFDPYRKWLGIPPKHQPPNHYRLLAIELFEDDPDVIEAAADQRMAHVRTYQAGQNSALSQKILNELSAAKLCLLDPTRKAAYDAKLRQETAAPAEPRAEIRIAGLAPTAEIDAALSSIDRRSPPRALAANLKPRPAARPAWVMPAAVAGGAVLLFIAIGIIIRPARAPTPRDSEVAVDVSPETKRIPKRPPSKEVRPQRKAKPPSLPPPAEQPLSLVADVNHRPKTAGVIADRIVLWNQHNDYHQDRGTHECDLSLWRDGSEVWRQDAIEIPWSPDAEQSVSVTLPPVRFDRVRVEITKWEQDGGGLAEIEVFRGDRNLARGCPAVSVGSLGAAYAATKLTDSIATSYFASYWLLPQNIPGWAEIDLAFAEPRPCKGIVADKLVIWNAHNANHNDRGALALNVRLSLAGKEVWRRDEVAIPWQADMDGQIEIALPQQPFDVIRVEVPRWQGLGGGLSEVQVFQGETNVARACPVMASGCLLDGFRADKVVDGITSSLTPGLGYWLIADNVAGWVELDLSCNCREIGGPNRELGQYRALVEKDWLHGLPWLARGEAPDLRALASLDEISNPFDPQALASIGDGWWDVSRASHGEANRAILIRALYRYAGGLSFLAEFDRVRIGERMAQCLPLPEGTWLYLLHESEISRVFANNNLREPVIVSGLARPWGLWMHPYADESASATFSLSKKYRRFTGAAAIADSSQARAFTAMNFKVLADGRELWHSSPLQQAGASEAFDLDVAGVEQLRLVVECPGSNQYCHAVWIDPILDAPSGAD